jgi:probable F420-dependent oxidoreductase
MATERRYGITIPFDGRPLHAQGDLIREIEEVGYTDVWSSEAGGGDGFTPLVLASVWAPKLRLGSAIIPAYTRGPAAMAQSVAALADAAPGRVAFGIGTSSNVIVERWNGIPFEKPYQRTRDMVRFLRVALTGEKVSEDYETFSVKGFRLGLVPEQQPKILVAALREGMLRLAGREGDGAIINWLSADDVKQVAPHVHSARREGDVEDKEIVARIFVIPTDDADTARGIGRFAMAAYLSVPVYREFHEWLGRGEQLQPMWDAWAAGDRARALELVPDEVVDALIVWGTPAQIRTKVERYAANGATTTAPSIVGRGEAVRDTIRALAPLSAPGG